jgi:hypothetical protein
MSNTSDDAARASLSQLLADHGLNPDTRLYRETLRSALMDSDHPGQFRLAANPAPSESVVDLYGQGYLVQAEQVGPGLAFAESARPNWQETMEMRTLVANRGRAEPKPLDSVEVEVRLGDILDQGGLLYPVESVTVEKAWYCTLPTGGVEVREVL